MSAWVFPAQLADADVMSVVEVLFRWAHVGAVLVWVGTAFGLAWITGPLLASGDAALRDTLERRLLPRALFFFRYAALYAFAFGLLLLVHLYYTAGDSYFRPLTLRAGVRPDASTWLVPLASLFVAYGVYDGLCRLAPRRARGWLVFLPPLLALALVRFLVGVQDASNRCAWVHAGALVGTVMVANSWSVVWPAWRRALTALRAGTAPDREALERAAERSRHNVYLAFPALLVMLAVHQSFLLGLDPPELPLAVIFLSGFAAARALFAKAARLGEDPEDDA